jgi:hypothetical protein
MLRVFFNRDGLHLIDILPQNRKMNAGYFAENIVRSLVSVFYPDGRRCRARKYLVHFDNAPIHNSKLVTEKLMEGGLKRMPHPVRSRNRSRCEFFLFGYLKHKLIDKAERTPEELFRDVETIISEITSDMISRGFLTQHERLRKRNEMQGNYIEQMLHFRTLSCQVRKTLEIMSLGISEIISSTSLHSFSGVLHA